MRLDFVLHQAASGYIWKSQYDRQKVYTTFHIFAVDLLFLLLLLYAAAEHAVATVVKAILVLLIEHSALLSMFPSHAAFIKRSAILVAGFSGEWGATEISDALYTIRNDMHRIQSLLPELSPQDR